MSRWERAVRRLVISLVSLVVVATGGCSGADVPAPPLAPPATQAGSQQPASQQPASRTPASPATPAGSSVPPPSPGSVKSAVKPRKTSRQKPVSLSAAAEAADGVQVELSRVLAITAEATGPGEVAGPALQIEVRLRNGTDRPVRTDQSAITLNGSNGDPGAPMSGPPSSPLPLSVAAGQDATGTYVFNVPSGQRDPVTVEVSVDPTLTTTVFRGPAPR